MDVSQKLPTNVCWQVVKHISARNMDWSLLAFIGVCRLDALRQRALMVLTAIDVRRDP